MQWRVRCRRDTDPACRRALRNAPVTFQPLHWPEHRPNQCQRKISNMQMIVRRPVIHPKGFHRALHRRMLSVLDLDPVGGELATLA
jgi:hypothetical protein